LDPLAGASIGRRTGENAVRLSAAHCGGTQIVAANHFFARAARRGVQTGLTASVAHPRYRFDPPRPDKSEILAAAAARRNLTP